ncbi:MAG: hypothetical protein QG671_3701 [Actinomycetota bacterium]|nr:hypothetical protein [Actinomycetota bacterium]
MSHQENPYPVDPTGPLTIGGIPDAELGPLFDALPADPNKHIERLRSAIADVDPASLTGADLRAILALLQAAFAAKKTGGDK